MSLQLETETHNGHASVIQVMDGAPYKSVAVTCVGGTCAYVLLNTGATTSFIRSELARILKDKPGMRPYDGHLQTAVRQGINFDGRITANLTIGEIDNIFEALVVPRSKNQMIPVATGLTDGSTVQVLYATLKLVLKQMPTIPLYPAEQRELNSTRARNRVQRL